MSTFDWDSGVDWTTSADVWGPGALTFVDETGKNPLPAGILVSIYTINDQDCPDLLIAAAWTYVGGIVPITTLIQAKQYQAWFFGTQAPDPIDFTLTPTESNVITVTDYRSPVLSPAGYADVGCELQPLQWYSVAAQQPGGVLHSIIRAALAPIAQIDAQNQSTQGAMRSQSSIGEGLDSWAADFLGSYITRYQNESDATFYGRILSALQTNKCTRLALQAAVISFYASLAGTLVPGMTQTFALGTSGALGLRGGLGRAFQAAKVPFVAPVATDVWDKMSNPTLAAIYNINEPEFVVQIGEPPAQSHEFALGTQGALGRTGAIGEPTGAYSLTPTPPDPRLGALINFIKAAGTVPLYLVFHT